MFASNDYQLLDFGNGRRLEQFGPITLDRPCPAADPFERADLEAWAGADARFEGREEEKGAWTCRRELPERWTVAFDALRLELKRTDFGHLGVFPEQAENWEWIGRQISPLQTSDRSVPGVGGGDGGRTQDTRRKARIEQPRPHPPPLSQRARGEGPKILNLFAYTGGSTLAAAVAGAEVVHVDAAKNIVAWARRNAELSGLAGAPIRWITEDATKFVARELKRGKRYDAVILDPPSFGHGSRGEAWQFSKHLPGLLAMCAELTAGQPDFMLLTCHTPGYDPTALCRMLREALGGRGSAVGRPLVIRTPNGRELPSGVVVRWKRGKMEI